MKTNASSNTAAAEAAVGPSDHDEIEGRDDRGRRWYHPRPQPRRRRDLMGFNSTWWMVLLRRSQPGIAAPGDSPSPMMPVIAAEDRALTRVEPAPSAP